MSKKKKVVEEEVVVKTTDQSSNLPVKVDVDKLVETNVVQLYDRFTPNAEKVKEISNSILENTKLGDLEMGGKLVHQMTKKAKVSNLNKKKGFISNKLSESKWWIQRTIDNRKSVKTSLEQIWIEVDDSVERLEDNLGKVRDLKESAITMVREMNIKIMELEEERDALKTAYAELEKSDEVDGEYLTNLKTAIQRFDKVIADTKSLQFIHKTNVAQLDVQCQERETLVVTMRAIVPQLDALITQQLATLASQLQVRKSGTVIVAITDEVNKLAKESARGTREDAKMVAEIANSPIIEKGTIEDIADSLRGMIADVDKVIRESNEERNKAIEAVKKNEKELNKTFFNVLTSGSEPKQIEAESQK